MPNGLVRSGNFSHGTPITLPHNFGNQVTLGEPQGNVIPQSNPTLDSNPISVKPSPTNFGNAVELSMQAAPPVVIIQQGASMTLSIPITDLNKFVGTVTLSFSGAPAGVTVTFSPNPATTQSTATVTVGSSVPSGKYTITVTGQTATKSYNTNIHLVVTGTGGPSNQFGFLLEDGSGVLLLEDGTILLLENQS